MNTAKEIEKTFSKIVINAVATADTQKNFASVVYRAGIQQGSSFDFEDKFGEGNHYI